MAQLKFYKGGSQPTAVGSVWFDKDNNLIKVIGETGVETYGGVQKAAWDATNKKLTITNEVGTSFELDFSDVASAQILGALRTELNTVKTDLGNLGTRVATAEGEIDTLQSEMDAVEAKAAANETAIGVLNGNAETAGSVAKAVADAEARVKVTTDALAGRVGTLETTTATNTANIATNTQDIADLKAAVGEGGSIADIIDNKLQDYNTDVIEPALAGKLDKGAYTGTAETLNTAITTEATTARAAEKANADAIAAEKARIDTLVGAKDGEGNFVDAGKSVRTIANEELAAQLLAGPDGAVDNFKTLQELAAWLEEHPEDAAAMNEAINANSTAIEGIQGDITNINKAIEDNEKTTAESLTDLNSRATALEGKVDVAKVSTAISEAVTPVANRVTTLETTVAGIPTQISTAKSEAISAVKGDAVDYDTLGKVETKLDAIDNAIAGLDSAAVKSVSGSTYIDVTGDKAAVVAAKTGTMDYAANTVTDGLATTTVVKTYVDAALAWAHFE